MQMSSIRQLQKDSEYIHINTNTTIKFILMPFPPKSMPGKTSVMLGKANPQTNLPNTAKNFNRPFYSCMLSFLAFE